MPVPSTRLRRPLGFTSVTVSSEQAVHPLVKSCLEPMLEACRLCKRRVLLPDPEPAASRIYRACSTRALAGIVQSPSLMASLRLANPGLTHGQSLQQKDLHNMRHVGGDPRPRKRCVLPLLDGVDG